MSASVFDSCSFTYQFKLNYEETKNSGIGHIVSSEVIYAGGHLWRVDCYPHGSWRDNAEHILVFLWHLSESKHAKAIFEAFVMDGDGAPSSTHRKKFVHVFTPKALGDGDARGWSKFVERSILLDPLFLIDGSVIIMCGVKVVHDDDPLDAPSSDIGSILLDSMDGSDVSFVVGGEMFPAHRAVLAARSPVFMAQLLGSMADAKMPSITLQDIKPATFKAMLQFMYTDALSAYGGEDEDEDEDGDENEDEELGGPSTEMFQDLLAAADRYALDRLKHMCARKLWDGVSTDTVGATLACAETYNCPELRKKCIDYFALADEKNFKKAVLTEGFGELVQNLPSIFAELRVKAGGV